MDSLSVQARRARCLAGLIPILAASLSACAGGTATLDVVGAGGHGGASAAVDAGPSCGPGLTDCNGVCVVTQLDPKNCGTCGNACPDGDVCSVGTCVSSCPTGTLACAASCVDPKLDPSHCGSCANVCPPGQVCSAGICGIDCLGGSTKCGGACVDEQSDPLSCGACGNACPSGQVCSMGVCGVDCLGGSTLCGAACVDLQNDPQNCGACGNACAASQICSQGTCGVTCLGATVQCAGVCVKTLVDPNNCGACGNACPQGQACSLGVCTAQCQGGSAKCGALCVDLKDDPGHCGACGKACVANQACSSGVCSNLCSGVTSSCPSGCADLKNDPNNCGACANVCPGGQLCSQGVCSVTCEGGTTLCGSACVNTSFDAQNCGGCGQVCMPAANGTAVCNAGTCATLCSGLYQNCNGVAADGCETNTSTSAPNCGACGSSCPAPPHADPTCANSQCGGACKANWGNCDANMQNGCEVDLLTDALHCGTCAKVCPSAPNKYPVCNGGVCGLMDISVSCKALHASNPGAASGNYKIDPDGPAGPLAPFNVYCDMATSGGGWTIVAAYTGADNEYPLTSDVEAIGNPLDFAHWNLNQAKKMGISAISTESVFVRQDGTFIHADKPMFDSHLSDPGVIQTPQAITLTSSDNSVVSAFMGYTTNGISAGGDFGIAMSPDGWTCAGFTSNGFDQNNPGGYRYLNCGCQRLYIYSDSAQSSDGDAGYDVNTGLGAWSATNGCDGSEGGALVFYAAMR